MTDDVQLKACPFCGDPMKQPAHSGVQHRLSGKKSAKCILFHMGFQSPEAWNTRASADHIARQERQIKALREALKNVRAVTNTQGGAWKSYQIIDAALKETPYA